MKIRELIAGLQKFDQEASIFLYTERGPDWICDINEIDQDGSPNGAHDGKPGRPYLYKGDVVISS